MYMYIYLCIYIHLYRYSSCALMLTPGFSDIMTHDACLL